MERFYKKIILSDLFKKMVFLVGPRQVGKTYLAKEILKEFKNSVYLNYDNISDKKIIENQAWLEDTDMLVLDEIHKLTGWKNYVKGIYDTKPEHLKMLITGSARLQAYSATGDSLAGRYFKHRLLPFTLSELEKTDQKIQFKKLLDNGGFPEPFLSDNIIDIKRWRGEYINALLNIDILEFENIRKLKTVRMLLEILLDRVGYPISYKSIAEDLNIAPNTVKKYIQAFENLYIIFTVAPFSKNIARAILKEPKIYFFDNGLIKGNNGIKLENFVAVSLLKHCFEKQDIFGEPYKLSYLRTKEKKEVDFCITCAGKILKIIEVKNSDQKISKALKYFNKKYKLPAIQLTGTLKNDYQKEGISVLKAEKFLKNL
ncbi:MAG: ATP-binding protein [Deltaproteobacteria bacterium]|nr:ATP-binding protein [Deltaproteobacteria bacterium]